jgi:uncharacterized repeat protein (TIGR03803 family)
VRPSSNILKCVLVAATLLVPARESWGSSTESVIYSFGYGDANIPDAGLVFDKSGNLYGTTGSGGAYDNGAVFKLTPSNGAWTETVIYSFCPNRINCTDGSWPITDLVFDATGNLYGTTFYGGSNGCGNSGCGVVFELSPSNGSWTETVLYTFTGGSDGAKPFTGVVFDQQGNLYGTTASGGTGSCNVFWSGCGTVFQLSSSPTGWTETVLHSFNGRTDGNTPSGKLIFDTRGNLYGTTAGAAPTDPGTVFQLTKTQSGWKEKVLYRFAGQDDGNSPEADLVLGKNGSLYGTTRYGGNGTCSVYGYTGCGTVFEVKHSQGTWTERVLHSFRGGSEGAYPAAGLIFNNNGNLYGTTAEGGVTQNCGNAGCGTVFKLTPNSARWNETFLHKFGDTTGDGAFPLGDLIFDSLGNLYSTTQYGGAYNEGSVFEIAP